MGSVGDFGSNPWLLYCRGDNNLFKAMGKTKETQKVGKNLRQAMYAQNSRSASINNSPLTCFDIFYYTVMTLYCDDVAINHYNVLMIH